MAHFLKDSTKGIKRSLALILSFVIIATVLLCTAATTNTKTVANSTEAENNATPKYYNALEHFSSTNNYAGSENIFGYQFKTDKEYDEWQYLDYCRLGDYWYNNERLYREDFPSLTDEQWNAIRGDKNYYSATWMLAISASRYMHLRNYKNCMANLTTVPAVAYLFTAKNDGYINIPKGEITLFTTNIASKGYKAQLRITKNGENIYPATGYMELDDNTKATYPDLDFAVNAGDEIRFELTSNVVPNLNEDDRVWVKWNPYISIRGEQYLYTETEDIYNGLTGYMNEYFNSQSSQNMTATDALTLAKENAKKSNYGVYTAYGSLYSGGIIPSEDSSVWKYASAKAPAGFDTPTAAYSLSAAATENGVKINWNSGSANGINAVKVLIDGKSYTYMANVGNKSIELPISLASDTAFLVQVSDGSTASEVLEVTKSGSSVIADKDNVNKIIYLSACSKAGTGITSEYILNSPNSEGSYRFIYAMNAVTSQATAEEYRRTIAYKANESEQMMFGFTAPQSGKYEVTAPIEVKNDATVKYSVLKQDENEILTVIDGPKDYRTDKSGFVALVSLGAGETVWLNASSTKECEIHIGIPSVTYKEETTDSAGTAAYKYRAVDYVESSYFNNRVYSSASLTDKLGTVWEFGTFENPIETVDGVTNYDTLGYAKLKAGDDASGITELFKPYEILRGGIWYNPLTMVVSSTGTIAATHANGVAGTLHTLLGTSYSERDKKGVPYLSKGFMVAVGISDGKDGKKHNMGIYMKFTAPHSGNVTLNLSDFVEARTATNITVLKGDTVVKTYASVIPMGDTVDLGYMNKGETAYICYGVANNSRPYNYGGFPVATVSGEKATFSFASNPVLGASATECLVTKNTQFILPGCSDTVGKTVIGWNEKGGSYYSVGRKYTVKTDKTFNPLRRFYGDMTGDNRVNATDLSIIRKNIIGGKADLLAISDVTSDGSLNLKDLVRIKKWLAGYAVPFNQD